jgi:hypothetical protein
LRNVAERGTRPALWRSLVQHAMQRGGRRRDGPATGPLEWRRPNRLTWHNRLQHPLAGGTYASGRCQVDPRQKPAGRPRPGRGTRPRPASQAFKSMGRPPSPGRRTSPISPAEKPTAPVLRRWAPSGLAHRGGRVCGSVDEATVGGRGAMGAPANGIATRASGWPPPLAGPLANSSPRNPSIPSSGSGSSPPSNPPPSRGRGRRRRVSRRNGRTVIGGGTSAWSGRRLKRNGPPAPPASSRPPIAEWPASAPRSGQTSAWPPGSCKRRLSAWCRGNPARSRRQSGRPSGPSRPTSRPCGMPPRRRWQSGKRAADRSASGCAWPAKAGANASRARLKGSEGGAPRG